MSRTIDAEHFDERVRLAVGVVFGDLTNDFKNGILATLEMLKTEPTADVKPVVRGEWIDEEYDIGECYATCSVCGEISQGKAEDNGFGYDYSFSNYCPNCGARMVEE